ncbi:hypothetical protein ALP45_200112 [Pseudomonas coronafaciens pv. atropurpurea]|nr:hypothetical protein ALO89_200190 [Pseudomonas coronafaciens pv. porri]RMT65686.1 hypothetical protein ALP45_200112 [Pseudomonas coronafaciens pv. atropurpurea]
MIDSLHRRPVEQLVIDSGLHTGLPISTTPLQTANDRHITFSLMEKRT